MTIQETSITNQTFLYQKRIKRSWRGPKCLEDLELSWKRIKLRGIGKKHGDGMRQRALEEWRGYTVVPLVREAGRLELGNWLQ